MATVAIKGHPERGNEVIEILEMLGGKNRSLLFGDSALYYAIDREGIISTHCEEQVIQFTLEEFLEKFPYKVGDKVTLDKYPCIITGMDWDCDDIIYYVKGTDFSKGVYSTNKDLQPYKEETMEDKLEQITFDIPNGYEFFGINDDNQVVLAKKQPKYPKTYEECCNVLGIEDRENGYCGYEWELLGVFQKLYICRDAYWKIAGEQMGLGKDWKPDYDSGVNKYGIICFNGVVQKSNPTTNWERHLNKVLDFPTEEMRDAFYENFKDLINECKDFI